MRLRLPGQIETDQGVTVILDDGRRVHIYGSGEIFVYSHERQLGNEDYSLTLPAVAYVQEHCDNPRGRLGNGKVAIQVEHRH